MAILSAGDGGLDLFPYDETTDAALVLEGEGSPGDALVIQGLGGLIRPTTPGGGGSLGDVSRSAATVDNRIARWHGTGPEIQNTGITIDDSDNISGYGTLTGGSSAIQLTDSDGYLRILAIGQNGATDRQAMVWDNGAGDWIVADILEPGGVDISDDTNLAATSPIVLTGDTLSHGVSGVGAGTYTSLTVDARGHATGATNPGHVLGAGSGTNNRIAKWTPDGNTIGNSDISDDGFTVTVATNDFTVTAGTVTAATHAQHRFGNMVIGQLAGLGAAVPGLQYFSMGALDYAFLQSNTGGTTMNAATGQTVTMAIHNALGFKLTAARDVEITVGDFTALLGDIFVPLGIIKIGNATTVTPVASANDFVIDRGGGVVAAGMTLVSVTSMSIAAADAASNVAGVLTFLHPTNNWFFEIAGSNVMNLDASALTVKHDLVFDSSTGEGLYGGSMYVDNGAITVNITAIDTFVEIGSTWTASGTENGVTFTGGHQLTVDNEGVYEIIWDVGFIPTNLLDDFEAKLMVDHVVQAGGSNHTAAPLANSPTAMGGSTRLTLNANDVVSLAMANHNHATRDCEVQHASVTLKQVAGS